MPLTLETNILICTEYSSKIGFQRAQILQRSDLHPLRRCFNQSGGDFGWCGTCVDDAKRGEQGKGTLMF